MYIILLWVVLFRIITATYIKNCYAKNLFLWGAGIEKGGSSSYSWHSDSQMSCENINSLFLLLLFYLFCFCMTYHLLFQALEMKNGDKTCLVVRAKCYLMLGNAEKALADANAALEQDEDGKRDIRVCKMRQNFKLVVLFMWLHLIICTISLLNIHEIYRFLHLLFQNFVTVSVLLLMYIRTNYKHIWLVNADRSHVT